MIVLQTPSNAPIVVKIIEPKKDGLAEVLLGALGLTGVLVLIAVVAAVAFAAGLYWLRSRRD